MLGRRYRGPKLSFSAKRIAISVSMAAAVVAACAYLMPADQSPAAIAEKFVMSVGTGDTNRALPLLFASGEATPRLVDEYWIDTLGEKWMETNGRLRKATSESVTQNGDMATVTLVLQFRTKQARVKVMLALQDGQWKVKLPSLMASRG
jgi:hypothetical protein